MRKIKQKEAKKLRKIIQPDLLASLSFSSLHFKRRSCTDEDVYAAEVEETVEEGEMGFFTGERK